ncbi:hypothetical protein KEM55_004671 [Ascosphaera atra]|nr:hypothetical protein KEM55_004671 [Ascosphaera atra]
MRGQPFSQGWVPGAGNGVQSLRKGRGLGRNVKWQPRKLSRRDVHLGVQGEECALNILIPSKVGLILVSNLFG